MRYDLCILIPARFGHQQIPEKNLREVHGRALVKRALTHATYLENANLRICISTNQPEKVLGILDEDSLEEFKEIFENFRHGISVTRKFDIHQRPESLALPNSSTIETLNSVRESYIRNNVHFSQWLILQPTSPFRSYIELNQIMEKIMSGTKLDSYSLVSVTDVGDKHPERMYRINQHVLSRYLTSSQNEFTRRQDLERLYVRDGGFYVISDELARKGLLLAENSDFIVRKYPWSINIDGFEDLKSAQSVGLEDVMKDPNSNRSDKS